MGTIKVCAWCGSYGGEIPGPETEVSHGMCATCLHESTDWRLPAPKSSKPRAPKISRHRGAVNLIAPEHDIARPKDGRVI